MTDLEHSLSKEEAVVLIDKLKSRIGTSIFGQEDLITETLCTFLSAGHILMTGAPGLAKTTLVRVVSQGLGLVFGRVQFTPDLLPSDILGSEVLNLDAQSGKRVFEFTKGPIFVNLLLADEINRASPRTQSAMLEAMQEKQVTIAGQVHDLDRPFMVFATQNPFESEGTYPLPEAQLDRFLLHSIVDYPNEQSELSILSSHSENQLFGENKVSVDSDLFVLDNEQINALLHQSRSMHVESDIIKLISELIRSSRPGDLHCPKDLGPLIWYGAGPRAGISLISASKSLALIEGSELVRWRHVKRMAKPVLRHRICLANQMGQDEFSVDQVITRLLNELENRHSNICQE